jgi:hypothetical protein
MKNTIALQKNIGFALLFLVAILPTLLVKIPAMEDYLDHLSRMYILATAGTNDSNPYYKISWAVYLDLAMDLIVPLLGRFMDVETAGRIFFLASQVLVVTGAIALELAVKRRHEIAGFAALLTLHSMPFSLGLVNFEFGTGVALWGIASWIGLSRNDGWRPRLSAHVVFVAVLFLSHFFALGIYGLTIGLFELRKMLGSRSNVGQALIAVITLATPILFMLLLMKETGAAVGENANEWWLTWKPIWFALFFNGYSVTLAVGSAAALTVLLFYCGLKRSLTISSEGRWIAFGFLLVFIVMPFKLFGSRMADIRMLTAALLVLPAFVTFSPRTKPLGYFISFVALAIILINSSYVNRLWLSYRSDYAAMKASFALVRQGSFVLVGRNATPETSSTLLTDAPFWRAPTLAVYYANAFVSSLYTLPGQHAVEVRPDLKRLEVNSRTETYAPPSLATLQIIAQGGKVPDAPQYVDNWTRDFDYVYLLGPTGPNVLPDVLEKLTAERRFTLYRVRK